MRWFLLFLLLPLAPLSQAADVYPTEDTVSMVIDCMAEIGGFNQENLHTCSCRHDVIVSNMPYEKYAQAMVFDRYQHLPADKGAEFRDNKKGQQLIHELADVRKQAGDSCPVIKRIEYHPKNAPKDDDS